ncbi:2-C-methyl-D-erythritol 4-phosphate cytidylyltransferase [Leeia sp. TBRC 13508]|uniref:2-C-methyl-D-erythritol 4-phosphate cytidylyltransferase n=1 Tax=Leeia speluncae TaxID=2884804 RepID=A0ABS8D2S6_9NEIS|nr:2-C-methyl-D-erythritol 4-phosphate cytidylyltransferase [Leeia speluncae]MCB6182480.1 2-C-methyl-D-erythritol 4-phosphate cytidylyltransferase [Leeia speluncae]
MSVSDVYIALVPAAGVGARMLSDRPKQYLEVDGKPILWHTIAALHQDARISQVCVVIAPDDPWFDQFTWTDLPLLRVEKVGGASRAESVRNGLAALDVDITKKNPWILVHDAARPCLGGKELTALMNEVSGDSVGGILAVPVPDTVKRANADFHIVETVPREVLWLAQTPQMFRWGLLSKAHEGSLKLVTDEASAIEALGLSPRLVSGSRNNLKVTFPEDMMVVSALLGGLKQSNPSS